MTLSYPSKRTLESDADQVLNPLFTELEDTLEVEKDGQSLARGEQSLISLRHNSHSATRGLSQSRNDSPVSSFSENPNFVDSDFPPYREDNVPKETFSSPPLWLKHLDKIIFTSSCSLLVWVLFLLQKEEQFLGLNLSQLQPPITLSETEVPESVDNSVEFINYMERALAEINREQALKAKAQDLTPAVTPSVEIPPVSTTPTPQEQTAPSSPPQAPAKQQTATAPSSPSRANQGGPEREISSLPALPPPPPSQSSQSTPSPSSPSQTPSPTNSTEETPQESETTTTEETPQESAAADISKESPPENSAPSPPSHDQTLVGLLELGEHSAALLKVEGVTQRIMIGETVPDSNWTLAEISNNKARFKNGGQEKSMYVGESLVNN